jgi:hypothetical protein
MLGSESSVEDVDLISMQMICCKSPSNISHCFHTAPFLLQACRVADMWIAPRCLQTSLNALGGLQGMQVEELVSILEWLPNTVSATALPQYPAVKYQLEAQIVSKFSDVHGLLIDHDQLQRFRQLPFKAVRAWAASNDLVVDSENSVAVAISWWYGGEQGSEASEEQLKQLSQSLRVINLSTGKMLA